MGKSNMAAGLHEETSATIQVGIPYGPETLGIEIPQANQVSMPLARRLPRRTQLPR